MLRQYLLMTLFLCISSCSFCQNTEQKLRCEFKLEADSVFLNRQSRLSRYAIYGIKSKRSANALFKNWKYKYRGALLTVNKENFDNYVEGICDTRKYKLKKIKVYPEASRIDSTLIYNEIILEFFYDKKQ